MAITRMQSGESVAWFFPEAEMRCRPIRYLPEAKEENEKTGP